MNRPTIDPWKLAVLGLGVGCILIFNSGCPGPASAPSEAPPPPESTAPPREVIALGKLKPKGGILFLGATPGDRIDELHVTVGSQVKRDDVLVVMASRELRQRELELARAQLTDAETQIAIQTEVANAHRDVALAARTDPELYAKEAAAAQELIEVQQQRVAWAERQLEQLSELFVSEVNRHRELVSEHEVESARLELAQAKGQLREAQAQWETARARQQQAERAVQANLDLAETQLRAAEQPPLDALRRAVDLAEANLKRSTIRSPIDGTVLNLFHHQGDTVGERPILQLADLSQMICVAEVYESQLAAIDPQRGHRAVLTSSALFDPQSSEPVELRGTVFRKSDLIGQGTLVDPNPLAPRDRRTADVYIELDSASQALARHFVNLQVRVRIEIAPRGDRTESDGE